MAHPFANQVKKGSAAKFKAMTGKKSSGQSHPDEAQDKTLIKKMLKAHDAGEYNVGGNISSRRLDKRPRKYQEGGDVRPIKIIPMGASGLPKKEDDAWRARVAPRNMNNIPYRGRRPVLGDGPRLSDEMKKGGFVKKYASGGKLPKEEVKPLKLTQESDNKNWMKGLSEKEISSVLGTTTRSPSTGMREHKRGGSVDKFARGGRTKKKGNTNINIIIAGKDKEEAPPMPPPMLKPPMAPPPGAGPGGPPGGPMPPGMPPMKRGGAIPYQKGGKVPMKAGAETGQGRLDKIKAYGGKARG